MVMTCQKFLYSALASTSLLTFIFLKSNLNFLQRSKSYLFFIKAIVFCHVGISCMIEMREQYNSSVEEQYSEWCTWDKLFDETIFQNLHDTLFGEFFVTSCEDINDLVWGLNAYTKLKEKSAGTKTIVVVSL